MPGYIHTNSVVGFWQVEWATGLMEMALHVCGSHMHYDIYPTCPYIKVVDTQEIATITALNNSPFFWTFMTPAHILSWRRNGEDVSVRFHHMEPEMEKMNTILLFITRLAGWTTEHNISICITLTTQSSVIPSIKNWALYNIHGQPLSNLCILKTTLFIWF